ncbi:LysE family translocator [Solimonas sp. K1W22B-7]|uniref:LysE family transporter n=1 Tax=Solimonas sp. K1W22B-7 TaxID=2303331 RepID=UPI000E32D9FF|nr:LysE family transporter [Solimonas sp. K1W22B-7]AXQ30540.1 LysE family translocator [Solimonas sp. K1W22B-7]
MSAASLFAAVLAAHLLAVISPGPDFAVVTRQTLLHGRAAGVWTAVGIAAGIVFHVSYALFGLGWLIEGFPSLLLLLRGIGAIFLFYLGIGALRSRPAAGEAQVPEAAALPSAGQSFRIGLLCNLLNPKAVLFFVSLFAVMIGPDASYWLRLALAACIVGSTAAWFCFLAMALSAERVRTRLLRHRHWVDRATGAVLVGLALGILAGLAGAAIQG